MSLIVTILAVFYTGGVDTYTPTDFNASQLTTFKNAMGEINATVNKTGDALLKLQSNNIVDLVGGFFASAYQAARTTVAGVSTMFGITTAGIDALPLGSLASPLITSLVTLILIVFFVAILLHIVTKSDRS